MFGHDLTTSIRWLDEWADSSSWQRICKRSTCGSRQVTFLQGRCQIRNNISVLQIFHEGNLHKVGQNEPPGCACCFLLLRTGGATKGIWQVDGTEWHRLKEGQKLLNHQSAEFSPCFHFDRHPHSEKPQTSFYLDSPKVVRAKTQTMQKLPVSVSTRK